MCPCPMSEIRRFRRSSRRINMKIVNTTTMSARASSPRMLCMDSSGNEGGDITCTGTGCLAVAGRLVAEGGASGVFAESEDDGAGFAARSLLISVTVSDALCSTWLSDQCSEANFSLMFSLYDGSSFTTCTNCFDTPQHRLAQVPSVSKTTKRLENALPR